MKIMQGHIAFDSNQEKDSTKNQLKPQKSQFFVKVKDCNLSRNPFVMGNTVIGIRFIKGIVIIQQIKAREA